MYTRPAKQAAIDEITRRLVDYYQPLKVYLFGSEARGDSGPDSDLDFCVVLPDEAPSELYGSAVYRALWGVGTAADIVRFSVSEFERRASRIGSSLPAAVLREGKLLYESGRSA